MNHTKTSRIVVSRIITFIVSTGFLLSGFLLQAQNTNDILNLLVANRTISEEQADSMRAEAAIKQSGFQIPR